MPWSILFYVQEESFEPHLTSSVRLREPKQNFKVTFLNYNTKKDSMTFYLNALTLGFHAQSPQLAIH